MASSSSSSAPIVMSPPWWRMQGIATLPTNEKPVRKRPASSQLHARAEVRVKTCQMPQRGAASPGQGYFISQTSQQQKMMRSLHTPQENGVKSRGACQQEAGIGEGKGPGYWGVRTHSPPAAPESERMRKSMEEPEEKKSDGMGRMTYITAAHDHTTSAHHINHAPQSCNCMGSLLRLPAVTLEDRKSRLLQQHTGEGASLHE